MKSYQQSPSLKSKKRESAIKGKENKPVACKPVACSKGLFACERARGRVGIRKRLIEAAVEDREKPKVLQRLIGPFWRRGSGGMEAAAVGTMKGNGLWRRRQRTSRSRSMRRWRRRLHPA